MIIKDEVKILWKFCFNDSDEFIDLYFKMRYKDEVNRVICEDGKIIFVLQMIFYFMIFCDEVIFILYILGVCMYLDYRKYGVMKCLLKEIYWCMYEDGVLLVLLIFVEEWLFGYYVRLGYVLVFGYVVEQVRVDRLCFVFGCWIEVCEFFGVEYYYYFDFCMYGCRSCIQYFKEDFLVIMVDLRLGNGKLLVVWEVDKIVGMVFMVMGDDILYIKELLVDMDVVQDILLYEVVYIYKVQCMDYFILLFVDILFLGMVRVICVEELLKVFVYKYLVFEFYIYIEGDEVIQENNGYYMVWDGFCFCERVLEKKYYIYMLDGFIWLLLEVEYFYMSLMLN